MVTCPQCGVSRPSESFSSGRVKCFRCHIASVSLQYTYSQATFHGPTGKELGDRERHLFRKRMGYDPEPVPQRAELM